MVASPIARVALQGVTTGVARGRVTDKGHWRTLVMDMANLPMVVMDRAIKQAGPVRLSSQNKWAAS